LGPLTFSVVICHEGFRYPETVRWAVRRGAQLVFHPHAHIAEPGSYRPVTFGDLLLAAVRSTVAVGLVAVVLLQELLVFAL
jgi:predicted amidohydrolase